MPLPLRTPRPVPSSPRPDRAAVRAARRGPRRLGAGLLAGVLGLGVAGVLPAGPAAALAQAPGDRTGALGTERAAPRGQLAGALATRARAAATVDLARWTTGAQLRRGVARGTTVRGTRVVLSTPVATRRLDGRRYDAGSWTSPWTAPGLDYTELIASWKALTPGDSFLEVRIRGRDAAGHRSSWDTLARWADRDTRVRRTSLGAQADDLARVDVDTWRTASSAGLRSFQVRVTLMRRSGTRATPSLDAVQVMTSRVARGGSVATSAPGAARGVVLDVPRFSQMAHSGHYPRWGGGGQAWCSPTSTSMVLSYYDSLPRPRAYSWVPARHRDRVVDHAARMTYDHAYQGTGNWPFNTAYAAPKAGDAFVTRLTSLRQAEQFIAAGIPLVASISFGRGDLRGAPISATNGHLLVIVGFTAAGDVVVNDPAAPTRAGVRRTYDRGQFENAWLPTSGGLTYVIRDAAHRLPASPGNW